MSLTWINYNSFLGSHFNYLDPSISNLSRAAKGNPLGTPMLPRMKALPLTMACIRAQMICTSDLASQDSCPQHYPVSLNNTAVLLPQGLCPCCSTQLERFPQNPRGLLPHLFWSSSALLSVHPDHPISQYFLSTSLSFFFKSIVFITIYHDIK